MKPLLRWRMVAGTALLFVPGSCLVPTATQGKLRDTAQIAAPALSASAGQSVPAKPRDTPGEGFILPREPHQGLAMAAMAPVGTTELWLDGERLDIAPDGRFLVAFDRDAPATMVLRAVRGSARPVEMALAVRAMPWRIEHVNAPFRGSANSDPEFAKRRPAELEQINAARRVKADSNGWRQAFIWPVRGRLSGFFGSQRVYQGKPGSYHSGLDIAAPAGTPFVAPADGVVVLAAGTPFTLEGNLLILDHGMGLTSAFLHAAQIDVGTGQIVRQGERLGTVGATGRATGPHLHWGMRWRSAKLDPLPLLPQGRN